MYKTREIELDSIKINKLLNLKIDKESNFNNFNCKDDYTYLGKLKDCTGKIEFLVFECIYGLELFIKKNEGLFAVITNDWADNLLDKLF